MRFSLLYSLSSLPVSLLLPVQDFHRVVVYYQTQYVGKKYYSPIPLISAASHVIVAAYHLNDNNGSCVIKLNDVSPNDTSLNQMWIDVARMQGSGVKVMGMLGGALDTSFQNLHQDFDNCYASLKWWFKTYRLDGIDLDVEVSIETSNIVKLIKQLRWDFGNDFIITMAPGAAELSGGFGGVSNYTALEEACGNDIDWYNAQFYSGFGSMTDTTDYDNIVTRFPLDPSRLVAGTFSNSTDGFGYVELDTLKSTIRQLLQKYGDVFGGIGCWEYFSSEPDVNEPWTWAVIMKFAMVNWKEVLAAESYN